MLLALDFAHQWRVQAAAAGGAGRGREEADKRGLTERLGKLAERLRGAVPAAAQAADTQVGELERLLRRRLPTSAADQTNFLEDLKRSEARSSFALLFECLMRRLFRLAKWWRNCASTGWNGCEARPGRCGRLGRACFQLCTRMPRRPSMPDLMAALRSPRPPALTPWVKCEAVRMHPPHPLLARPCKWMQRPFDSSRILKMRSPRTRLPLPTRRQARASQAPSLTEWPNFLFSLSCLLHDSLA
mmetsp:Transcript_42380/g.113363  ORF Transcript_42380/g.113363 Transcript_42380/m.113363 type:complete len:244 (-) Transcript_42380:130-861(-)